MDLFLSFQDQSKNLLKRREDEMNHLKEEIRGLKEEVKKLNSENEDLTQDLEIYMNKQDSISKNR